VVRCGRLGNEGLVEVAFEALAQVGGKAVDIATQVEQRVLGRSSREGADGGPNRLRLRPSAPASPGFELLEIPLVEIHLQRSTHDPIGYAIMIAASTAP
jgi:hypothetical protein